MDRDRSTARESGCGGDEGQPVQEAEGVVAILVVLLLVERHLVIERRLCVVRIEPRRLGRIALTP